MVHVTSEQHDGTDNETFITEDYNVFNEIFLFLL